jgi:hypothetical protein
MPKPKKPKPWFVWCAKHKDGYVDLGTRLSAEQALRANEDMDRLKYDGHRFVKVRCEEAIDNDS